MADNDPSKIDAIEMDELNSEQHANAYEHIGEEKFTDNAHMTRLGKKQQFDRNFQLLSITAFSVVAMGGWIFVPNNSIYGLVDGNTGGTITMYLINFAAFSTIIMSLAEMSSMAPTAGGQYRKTTKLLEPTSSRPTVG